MIPIIECVACTEFKDELIAFRTIQLLIQLFQNIFAFWWGSQMPAILCRANFLYAKKNGSFFGLYLFNGLLTIRWAFIYEIKWLKMEKLCFYLLFDQKMKRVWNWIEYLIFRSTNLVLFTKRTCSHSLNFWRRKMSVFVKWYTVLVLSLSN